MHIEIGKRRIFDEKREKKGKEPTKYPPGRLAAGRVNCFVIVLFNVFLLCGQGIRVNIVIAVTGIYDAIFLLVEKRYSL